MLKATPGAAGNASTTPIMSRARQEVRSSHISSFVGFARPMGILTRGIASPQEVPDVKGEIQKTLNQGPDLRNEL